MRAHHLHPSSSGARVETIVSTQILASPGDPSEKKARMGLPVVWHSVNVRAALAPECDGEKSRMGLRVNRKGREQERYRVLSASCSHRYRVLRPKATEKRPGGASRSSRKATEKKACHPTSVILREGGPREGGGSIRDPEEPDGPPGQPRGAATKATEMRAHHLHPSSSGEERDPGIHLRKRLMRPIGAARMAALLRD